MRKIQKNFRKALAVLLLAVLSLAAVVPAAAEAAKNRRQSGTEPPAAPAQQRERVGFPAPETEEDDGPHSELSPYDENGEIRLTRSIPRTSDDDFSFIRVLINVGSVSTIRFNLVGSYYIDQNRTPLYGTAESPLSVKIRAQSGSVSVIVNDETLYTGTQADIKRVSLAHAAGYAQLRTGGYDFNDERMYLGHLRLRANSDGTVRFVNVIPTAHYLYGIIPYEMSESCEIEGLKAQAVTAKTYGFGFTYTGDDYDITDSFTYQGYRGYNPGYTKCMNACLGVIGKLMFYNGGVPLAFYGATNGGETALPSHAFGTSPLDDAYQIRIDNIDLQYGSSKLKTFEIEYGASVSNSSFRHLLEDQAAASLGHDVEILSVASADINTPKFSGTTRNMTKMDVTVNVLDGNTQRQLSLRFDVTKLKSYGVFSNSYKVYWGKTISGGYRVYFGRWGHGLGLSQYGADGFAHEGYNFSEILNFYFSKMDLLNVHEDNPERAYAYTISPVAYGVTNTSGVRMRSIPSTDGALYSSFPAGTHVKVISESDGWLLCIADGILGYIRGDLVDIVLFPSPNGAEQSIGRAGLANGVTEAALYTGPSEYCDVALVVSGATMIDIWNSIGSWYRVRVHGNFYYIRSELVSVMMWTSISLHSYLVGSTPGDFKPMPRP